MFCIVNYKYLCYYSVACLIYGDVAQLARAIGSYPIGRGFDPLRRYQNDVIIDRNICFFYLGIW